MKAMILAAGRGARMRPLTDTLPKPLVRLAGEMLIERQIRQLAAAGIRDLVINLGWLGATISAHLGDGARYGVRIAYSEEGWPALETGGGVRRALPLLGSEPFLVVSADIWTEYPLADLRARAATMRAGDLAHLVLVPNPSFHPGGDFTLEGGRIRNLPRTQTFGNLSILRPRLFESTPEGAFPIAGLWKAAAAADRVSGESYTGRWWNIGTQAQLREIESQLGVHPYSRHTPESP